MSLRTITRRIAEGNLISLGNGVLALPGVAHGEKTLLLAATAALGAVASHESAARLHGLEGIHSEEVVVSVPIRRSNRFAGVRVHQLTDIAPDHTTEVQGIPVTNPTRTMVDLAAVLREDGLASILDQAVRRGMTSYERVAQLLEELARSGKPGVRRLRGILEPRMGGTYVSDSTLETRLLGLIERASLPAPTTQWTPKWLKHMGGRVDLTYLEDHLIIEGDSLRWHGSPAAFQADRRRDNLAQLAGWTILRFTWEDITKRPGYVVASIQRALQNSAQGSSQIWPAAP